MKTSTDLIIDAIEAITKAGGSSRTLMDMSLSEAIVILHKNGLHPTLVDVNETPVKVDDGWISNIGRNKQGHPASLSPDTRIEVKFRNGDTSTCVARNYTIYWRETDGHKCDIIAYRILKDQSDTGQKESCSDGWISNIGRNKDWHPDNLRSFQRIEVKFRNGSTETGYADDWASAWWNEVYNFGEDTIIAYRILKD